MPEQGFWDIFTNPPKKDWQGSGPPFFGNARILRAFVPAVPPLEMLIAFGNKHLKNMKIEKSPSEK